MKTVTGDVHSARIGTDGAAEISCVIRNAGTRAGSEVAQLYLRDPVAQVARPERWLAGFARIELQPGEARRVTFGLHADRTSFHGVAGHRIVEPGTIEVAVGSSSADLRLHGELELSGPERAPGCRPGPVHHCRRDEPIVCADVVADSIEHEIVIEAARERVWELLTEPTTSAGGSATRPRPTCGRAVRLRSPGPSSVRTSAWSSGSSRRRASPTAGRGPPGEPADGNATRAEFTLIADGPRTRLRVVETGFASLDQSPAEREQAVRDNIAGWEHELDELRAYAERPGSSAWSGAGAPGR